MATLEWRGAGTTPGQFTDKTNWIDSSTGSTPASAPANSDTLIFNRGNVDVDDGLTTTLTGVTMVGTSGYSGRIGPASPLSIACVSLRWSNSGSLNITGNITAGVVRCRQGAAFTYAGGTATALYIENTIYSIAGAAVVTTLRTYRSQGSDLNNGTGYTLFEMEGGSHTSRRAGVFVLDTNALLNAALECVLTSGTSVSGKSNLYYTSGQTVAGAVTVRPGSLFNAGGAPSFAWSGSLVRWPGAKINLDTAGGTVTPSTVTQIGIGDEAPDAIPFP